MDEEFKEIKANIKKAEQLCETLDVGSPAWLAMRAELTAMRNKENILLQQGQGGSTSTHKSSPTAAHIHPHPLRQPLLPICTHKCPPVHHNPHAPTFPHSTTATHVHLHAYSPPHAPTCPYPNRPL